MTTWTELHISAVRNAGTPQTLWLDPGEVLKPRRGLISLQATAKKIGIGHKITYRLSGKMISAPAAELLVAAYGIPIK